MGKKNKVFLSDKNIIEIHVVGNQNLSSIEDMGREIHKLIEARRKAKKPVLILDVLLEIGEVPPEGRRKVVQLAKVLDYDKAAMVGSNAFLRLGTNLMLRASGRGEAVRYFENRDEAIRWLLN